MEIPSTIRHAQSIETHRGFNLWYSAFRANFLEHTPENLVVDYLDFDDSDEDSTTYAVVLPSVDYGDLSRNIQQRLLGHYPRAGVNPRFFDLKLWKFGVEFTHLGPSEEPKFEDLVRYAKPILPLSLMVSGEDLNPTNLWLSQKIPAEGYRYLDLLARDLNVTQEISSDQMKDLLDKVMNHWVALNDAEVPELIDLAKFVESHSSTMIVERYLVPILE